MCSKAIKTPSQYKDTPIVQGTSIRCGSFPMAAWDNALPNLALLDQVSSGIQLLALAQQWAFLLELYLQSIGDSSNFDGNGSIRRTRE